MSNIEYYNIQYIAERTNCEKIKLLYIQNFQLSEVFEGNIEK